MNIESNFLQSTLNGELFNNLSLNNLLNENRELVFENRRKMRSLLENITLTDACLIYDNTLVDSECILGIEFNITSSKYDKYNIQIWSDDIFIYSQCSCKYFTMRNKYCKHIYWIGTILFGEIEPTAWTFSKYRNIIVYYWLLEESDKDYIGRNENCPICLENIDYTTDNIIHCKYKCMNSVHIMCWNSLYNITGKTDCVVCRSDTMPYLI